MNARTLLALILLILPLSMTGCAPSERSLDVQELVIPVRNDSPGPVLLAVVRSDARGTVVGAARPATIPAHTTVRVRFVVPASADWTILANGWSTIGSADVRDRFPGRSSMSIDIDFYGSAVVHCRGDCP